VIPYEFTEWPCPAADGGTRDELALAFAGSGEHRILVLPAWFDEANKLRRQTVEVMRRLAIAGVASVLPDLPGCNESEAPLAGQTLEGWRNCAAAAARFFDATHVLAVRAGALLAPPALPGWRYAPIGGRQVLRPMLRARTIAAREAGREEKIDALEALALAEGIELAGWHLGPSLVAALRSAEPEMSLTEIDQSSLGGSALWLRAEPDEDPVQADMLAALVAGGLAEA
jgi:hypothetical protein